MNPTDFRPMLVRERPARRPRAPRRRSPAATVRRLRAAATGIVVVAAGGVMAVRCAGVAARPVLASCRTASEIGSLQARLAAEEARKRRLLAQIDTLKTPSGIEQEARRQGWVKRG